MPIAAVAVVGALMGRRKEPPHSCPPAAHVSAPRATSSRAASLGLFAERFGPSVVRLGRSVCRSLLFHTDDGASGMLLAPFLSCQDPRAEPVSLPRNVALQRPLGGDRSANVWRESPLPRTSSSRCGHRYSQVQVYLKHMILNASSNNECILSSNRCEKSTWKYVVSVYYHTEIRADTVS